MAASTVKHKMLGLFRKQWSVRFPVGVIAGVLVPMAAGLLACGGDATGSGPLMPSNAYWTLQLNYHAATFALTGSQDTLRLVGTPLNAFGQPLSDVGTVHFRTADSAVTVDSVGLVTAHYVTYGSRKATVIAELTDSVWHVTHVDTCYIQVKATTPSLPPATLTIQHAGASDTIMMPVDTLIMLRTTARNTNGQTVATFPYYRSTDPNIAKVDGLTGLVTGVQMGTIQLSAEVWAYGVALRDSLTVNVGPIARATINVLPVIPTGSTQPVLTFWPQIITVGAGAVVTWSNPSYTDSMDVVFDDPANVDSVAFNQFFAIGTGEGNIAPWVTDSLGTSDIGAQFCEKLGGTPPNCGGYALEFRTLYRQRQFPVAGTYHYHSRIWGTSGTIVVQ